MITFDVVPMGAPRMTRSDAWRKRPCVLRYFSFKDRLKRLALIARYKITDQIDITFVIPMPDSWSKKKKEEFNGNPHQSKPDADNLLKAYCDALSERDQTIWDMRARKIWGTKGQIIVNATNNHTAQSVINI